MADLTRIMLYDTLVPGRQLFTILIPVLIKTTVQIIAAKSLALSSAVSSSISHYALTSTYLTLPCQTWTSLPPTFRTLCRPDDASNLVFALLFTATLILLCLYLGLHLIYLPRHRIATTTLHLHSLERAITRQIEINHHLSRPSQNSGLQSPTCTTINFEQWALHWTEMQRLRAQAEKDFLRGVPVWHYDERPDCTRRKRELENELKRVQGAGREIVNAREGARRVCGKTKGGNKVVVNRGQGWLRRREEAVHVDEMGTRGRSGYDTRKASQSKAVFQQEIDTIGRMTPEGLFG